MQIEDAQMATWLDFVASLPKGRPSNPMSRAQLVQALVGALLQRLDLVVCRSFPPVDTVFNALVDYFRATGAVAIDEDLRRPDGPSSSPSCCESFCLLHHEIL